MQGIRGLIWALLGLAWRLSPPVRWAAYAGGFAVVLSLGGAVHAYGPGAAGSEPAVVEESSPRELLERARRARTALHRAESFHGTEIVPIKRVLLRYRPDRDLANRIAIALNKEARRIDLEPRVLLAVLLVENAALDPQARSTVGAVGLMQVMPFHRGKWPPCKPDLEDVEANICHGARIFAHYYEQTGGDLDRALLRYNGCVRGTNTPNCHQYPEHVFARAGRASMLDWMAASPSARAGAP